MNQFQRKAEALARNGDVSGLHDQLMSTYEMLVRSDQELQDFACITAQELRSPLRGIRSFAQLLQQECGCKGNDKIDAYLGFLLDNALRMQHLIQDLLAYARLNSRTKPFEDIPLGQVLDRVLSLLADPIGQAGARIECDELPSVRGDLAQLTHLLLNLIDNGIKYRQGPLPTVSITARQRQKEWLVSIRDNGIGINQSHHRQIFEMFKRLHSHQDYPGSGMGLAICQRIVTHHGGRIWVESELGKGSTFHFTLATEADDGDAFRREG